MEHCKAKDFQGAWEDIRQLRKVGEALWDLVAPRGLGSTVGHYGSLGRALWRLRALMGPGNTAGHYRSLDSTVEANGYQGAWEYCRPLWKVAAEL